MAAAAAASPPYAPYQDTAPYYTYGYNVYNGARGYGDGPQKFAASEDRDGYKTHGEYSVLLPDGRLQRVVYQVIIAL